MLKLIFKDGKTVDNNHPHHSSFFKFLSLPIQSLSSTLSMKINLKAWKNVRIAYFINDFEKTVQNYILKRETSM